jgi:Mrp family chromosome partitioning ATPase
VLVDAPPVNIVSDPLVITAHVAGCLFVVRQDYSDHRDIRKALSAAEMTGMEVLGFVYYGENLHSGSYYSRKYYKGYYNKYDYRSQDNTVSRARDKEKGEKNG